MAVVLRKLLPPMVVKPCTAMLYKKCYSVFGIKDLIQQDKLEHFSIKQIRSEDHETAVDFIKRYYLPEHVLVKAKQMDLNNDRAIDFYLFDILKQDNSLYATTSDGRIAGVCVSVGATPIDPEKLRNFAFYRQDPHTRDFFYFTAKLQETPNLWKVFKEDKVYEIKMLAVLPEYRRQGLGVRLAEMCLTQAREQEYKVIRMDCINPYDYKIAERCSLQCIVKFPLHKLRGSKTPYIKRDSEHNGCVRVYVDYRARVDADQDTDTIRKKQADLISLIE